jgi:predicted nucleic acid-binding protein
MEAAGRVVVPTDDDWKDAWAAYKRGEAAGAGMVDHVSFVLMRRLGITDVFTNDRHFRAAGFHALY